MASTWRDPGRCCLIERPAQRCVWAFLLLICSFMPIGRAISSGIDPSWHFAMNWAFVDHLHMGRDILFTYGPLGFLFYPLPMEENLAWAMGIWIFLRFSLARFLVEYVFVSSQQVQSGQVLIKLGLIFLILLYLKDYSLLLIVFAGTCLLLHNQTQAVFYLFCAMLICVFAFLCKAGAGVMTTSVLGTYALYMAMQRRSLYPVLFIIVGMGGLVSFVWWGIYHDLRFLPDYLLGAVHFSAGYSSAMSINPDNNWLMTVLFAGLFLSPLLLVREKPVHFLYGIFALTIWLGWKYSITRADAHLLFFISLVVEFFLVLLIVVPRRAIGVALLGFACVFVYSANVRYMGVEPTDYIRYSRQNMDEGWSWLGRYVFNWRDFETELLTESAEKLQKVKLGQAARGIVHRASVDIYPWEISIVPANNLRWQPRPIFQSYTAYNSWLDARNAAFFLSPNAPEYVIWHKALGKEGLDSIDDRYLLNDEPLTIRALFNQYRLVMSEGDFSVMKRSDVANFAPVEKGGQVNAVWGQWIDVPDLSPDVVVRGKVYITRALLQQIKKLLYKEQEFYMEYLLENGEIRRKRIIIDNARSGLWVSPYIMGIGDDNTWEAVQTRKIRLLHSKDDFIAAQLRFEWEVLPLNYHFLSDYSERHRAKTQDLKLPSASQKIQYAIDRVSLSRRYVEVVGWAHIVGQDADQQQIFLVLHSAARQYVFDTAMQDRPDVTAHFQLLNYNSAGFSSIVSRSELQPGRYRLGLLILKGQFKQFCFTDEELVIEDE